MGLDEPRRAAYIAAYDLFEAVQSERHAAAVAALPAARQIAARHGWADVGFVLQAAGTVHAVTRSIDPAQTKDSAEALVTRAEELGAPAMLAIALALRAVASSAVGDTAGLMADASRAVALLDDEHQPPLDRCTGLVVAAAAFNTLRLWELVDELYTRAGDLEPYCEAPAQAAAIAVNRVITRVEWALALLENGDPAEAETRLAQAAEAVPAALAQQLPPLWLRDVEACAAIIGLLRGQNPDSLQPSLAHHRQVLAAGGDIEVLPLLEAATALALWRIGRPKAATAAADQLAPAASASSGARSFPLWARAHILAGAEPSDVVKAQQDHAALLGQLRWESRQAVLVATRSQIAAERRRAEHESLSRAVNTDPLTGLSNRLPFNAWLERRAPARQLPMARLLVDLDEFKQVNDAYGHDCGDEVLRRFGQVLLSSVRPGDLAVRHGGDEFAVLLESEHLTLPVARQRALDLLTSIAAEPWGALAP
ncbi:MAG: hypothetical protein QOE05_332, partial [Actinomycetota bacterium]|nr:hypothetical protein [Actinomycetota bacterium]